MLGKQSTKTAILLLLVWAALLVPKALFACDLMEGKVQSTCCCELKSTGCEQGGDCKGHNTAATSSCCDISYAATATATADDSQNYPVTKPKYPEVTALPPDALSLAIKPNWARQLPPIFRFLPSGKQLYLTTARFRE